MEEEEGNGVDEEEDEAHFHLCGAVNKQNFRYWAENNPRIIQERRYIPLN